MDLVLRYSNQGDRIPPLADVVQGVNDREQAGYSTVTPPLAPHDLSDEQVAAMFSCYRAGTGPRELAGRYGVIERAIKYLLKKHGVQRTRRSWEVIGGRA